MRNYLVTYDISDPKRLRRVYECMKSWGEHVQYSVFRCVLDASGILLLQNELHGCIHHDEDQILFFDLGVVGGHLEKNIQSLGKPYAPQERRAIII